MYIFFHNESKFSIFYFNTMFSWILYNSDPLDILQNVNIWIHIFVYFFNSDYYLRIMFERKNDIGCNDTAELVSVSDTMKWKFFLPLWIPPRIRNYIRKYFRIWERGSSRIEFLKKEGEEREKKLSFARTENKFINSQSAL